MEHGCFLTQDLCLSLFSSKLPHSIHVHMPRPASRKSQNQSQDAEVRPSHFLVA